VAKTDTTAADAQPSGGALPASLPLDLKTPLDHGRALGLVANKRNTFFNDIREEFRSAEYRAAETLHGWGAHSKHTADAFTITAAAFKAAIDATNSPDERGNYSPHVAALAPHLRGNY
jgi:hypothetical protein